MIISKTRFSALTIAFILSMAVVGTSEDCRWTRLGPEGGTIFSLAIAPQTPKTVYAVVERGGILKSTDGGGSWIASGNGITSDFPPYNYSLYGYSLAIDPKDQRTIFAGIYNGVYKSTDGGDNWSWTPMTGTILAVTIDPVKTQTIYASTPYTVYR